LTYSTNATSINALVGELTLEANTKSKSELDQGQTDNNGDIRISIHKVDVSSADEISRMFTEIQEEHRQLPDILISNAGYGKRIPQIWDIPLEEFDYMLNINLRASFILVKGAVEHMKAQRWGRIVFMSSIAAYGGGINGCRMLWFSLFFFFFFCRSFGDIN
jgi:3-oxoacyl-[acyl-carrier protein] reductase